MSFTVGSRLGPYEILSLIGTGGMGSVYKALDTRLDRVVAIKVAHEQFSERFDREARAVAALNHPRICHLYDIGPNYLVMEYVEGQALKGPLPLRQALQYGAQICEALDVAHRQRIVHRDLKPANILATKSGIKLLDFGLAKQQSGPSSSGSDVTRKLTQENTLIGTLQYMAPEQLQGKPADSRSDIFSFGCVLYELLIGREAFQGSDPASLISAIMTSDPPLDGTSDTVVPAVVERLLRKCLAKDPEARWQSVRDLRDELNWIALSDSAKPPAPAPPGPRSWPWWPWSVIALAAIASIGGAIFASMIRNAPSPTVHFEQLTFREGFVFGARFQPGNGFAYTAAFTGSPQRIYSGRAGDRDHREVPVGDHASLSGISPSGELAIRVPPGDNPADGQMLAIASSMGGPHRDVAENVLAADFDPNGGGLAIIASRPHLQIEYPPGHVLFQARDFQPTAIRISHDGKRIAVSGIRTGASSFNGEVGVLDRSGQYTALYKAPPGNVVFSAPVCWSPDSKEVWFTSREYRDAGVVYAANLSGRVRKLLELPSTTTLEDVGVDGRMLVTLGTTRSDIVVQNHAGTLNLPWFGTSRFPWLTENDRTLIFTEDQTGQFGRSIYRRALDGGSAVKLSDGFAISVSPSGRYVVAWRTDADPAYVIVPTGAGQERPIRMKDYELGAGSFVGWLPDEKNLVARAREPGHRWRLVLYSIETGAVRPITAEVRLGPEVRSPISTDGLYVFAVIDDRWLKLPIHGGTAVPVKGIGRDEHILRCSLDGKHVYLGRMTPAGDYAFFKLDPETGVRSAIAELPGRGAGPLTFDADISVDGTIAASVMTRRSTLYLVDGAR